MWGYWADINIRETKYLEMECPLGNEVSYERVESLKNLGSLSKLTILKCYSAVIL